MTGNPEDLDVIAAIETDDPGRGESFLHGMFQSRRVRGEFFALTAEEAIEGADLARHFLSADVPTEREAKRLGGVDCDAPARDPNEEERVLHRELLAAREEKYRAGIRCALLENELRVRTGTSEGLVGLVSWRPHTKTTFDETWFRREHSKLHTAYSRTVRQRTFRLLWS